MRARLVFHDFWEDLAVEFFKLTNLHFIPPENMQFHFESRLEMLVVEFAYWNEDEKILYVMLCNTHHPNKTNFIKSLKANLNIEGWYNSPNCKTVRIVDKILKRQI